MKADYTKLFECLRCKRMGVSNPGRLVGKKLVKFPGYALSLICHGCKDSWHVPYKIQVKCVCPLNLVTGE